MFPTTSDITPFNVEYFIDVARLMLKSGNRLLIVSKPRRWCISRIMDSLAQWREQILFRFTMGSMDKWLTALWEPGAPDPHERLGALLDAKIRGFARSISIEPMLGGVEETLQVVSAVSVYAPETIWIGKMNKINTRVSSLTPEVKAAIAAVKEQQTDKEILRLHKALQDNPIIRWKDSIKAVLAGHGIQL